MNISALEIFKDRIPRFLPFEDSDCGMLQKFAHDNQFSYTPQNNKLLQEFDQDTQKWPTWAGFNTRWAKKDIFHYIHGVYRGYTLSMFNLYEYSTNGKRYKNPTEQDLNALRLQQSTGVMIVDLPKVFPQILLDSNKNDKSVRSSIWTHYDNNQRIALEGDFSEYFDLYIPKGLQVNALTILAPNMMEVLKQSAGIIDVEIYNNKLAFMTRSNMYNPETISTIFLALDRQLDYFERLLPSWNYTPIQVPFDRLYRPVVTGQVMKIGSIRLTPLWQMTIILIGFGVFALFIIFLKIN